MNTETHAHPLDTKPINVQLLIVLEPTTIVLTIPSQLLPLLLKKEFLKSLTITHTKNTLPSRPTHLPLLIKLFSPLVPPPALINPKLKLSMLQELLFPSLVWPLLPAPVNVITENSEKRRITKNLILFSPSKKLDAIFTTKSTKMSKFPNKLSTNNIGLIMD